MNSSNLQEIITTQSLASAIVSHDSTLMANIASIDDYTKLLNNGSITQSEYVELLKDIQHQMNIKQDLKDIENFKKFNTIINDLIGLASKIL